MKRLGSGLMGIDQGDTVLFSDPFHTQPTVQTSVSFWDMDTSTVIRVDVAVETVTETGFDLVFHTWSDIRVTRSRIGWMAIGELIDEDNWDVM